MKTLLRLVTLLVALSLTAVVAHGKPQLGIETWTCREMTFEETVLFAKKHGITQLQLYRKHIDASAPVEENLRKKAFLEEHGVKAYTFGVCPTSMDKEENRKLFELAKLFGVKLLVVEPGNLAEWDNLEELVREYDIKLAIHNHGTGTVYGNPSTVKHILAARDHRIGVCVDIGWVTSAGFDAESVFRNYGDRVYDMHLKDKRLDQQNDSGRHVDTHIGLGNTNYAGLVAAIKESGWSGVMALETDSAEFVKDPTEFVTHGKKFFEAHFGK